jgi:hypothetical protein
LANCTYADVKRIITTNLSNEDITELIVLADAEITTRGLTTRNNDLLKAISMYLTADMIQGETIRGGSVGVLNAPGSSPQPNWREKAELLIMKSGSPPIYVSNDPVETGE